MKQRVLGSPGGAVGRLWRRQSHGSAERVGVPNAVSQSLDIRDDDSPEPGRRGRAFGLFDGTLFGDFAAFGSFGEQLRLSIYLNAHELPKRTKFVAAHMSFSTLRRGFPGGQLLTLLHEPLSRLLSLWLFWRSDADEQLQDSGQWGDRVRNSRHPFVDFLRATETA